MGAARAKVLIPMAVLLVAAGLRLWGLGFPHQLYWDEQYYVFDASAYLGGGIGQPIEPEPPVKIADEGTWVHPPLGKWAIALLGVGPLGNTPIGWRSASVVFGLAGVALLYLLALRMWGSPWWAGLAAALLALDGLHIVQSRMAMLDVFVSTFVTAGFLFLVMDRQASRSAGPGPRWRFVATAFGSPYRLAAGACLGAAVATKWSGAFALAFGAGLCTVWTMTGDRRGRRATDLATILASFAFVPLTVYLLSYGAFFYQHGFAVRDFIGLQVRMLDYHRHHVRIQPENAPPWTWPLLLRPTQYFHTGPQGAGRNVIAVGNPVLWWGFLVSIPIALVQLLRRATWQDAVAFGGLAAMYVPWFFVGRSQFPFYMTPAVPFMALCLVATIRRLPSRVARTIGIGCAAAAAIVAVVMIPVWLGSPATPAWLGRAIQLLDVRSG